ncbi:phage shock protein PspC (stress-responsive transcriptional regulator) [Dysgonomonas alginatilytica]|uniref:Phage shock protein PspC (Stress-responsive transcriptional regulator) n=1 Tax=Dysgonomonas alginatilytica TaxID=1605892 RepID=A0A2V3PTF7_9BACT|nr:PspC domain-containing protein [Dysgonomonas alginatilytica]PXV67458.1 phage shock protein PspC (stress-responsive transcriptional regulator) [Dysgonomonas alginatilytica]
MKKVVEVNIGGINFTIEDDAYIQLKAYLSRFEASLPKEDAKEIMEDVEARVAEIFQKEIKYPNQVIGEDSVRVVIQCLGEIDSTINSNSNSQQKTSKKMKTNKKLYRNMEDKVFAGVCGGLASYFEIDTTIIRAIFVLVFFFGGSALLAYIILWVIMPKAETVIQKMEMNGEPITPENLRNYSK